MKRIPRAKNVILENTIKGQEIQKLNLSKGKNLLESELTCSVMGKNRRKKKALLREDKAAGSTSGL